MRISAYKTAPFRVSFPREPYLVSFLVTTMYSFVTRCGRRSRISGFWKRRTVRSAPAVIAAFLLSANAANHPNQQGVELYRQHKYADAITALQQTAQGEKPDSADYREAMLLIGQSYFMLGQAPKAIPFLEKVPEVNEANYMLGFASLQNRQPEQAEIAFARLFGVRADSAAGHLMAARMMVRGQYDEQGVNEIGQALKLDAKLPEAHFLLAEVELAKGRIEEAVADLTAELAINPAYAMAWYRLGDALARQQHWTAAIPDLQRAVWLNPDFSGPFVLLGRCYFETGDLANADGILRQALKLDPANRSAKYLLSRTLSASGHPDEAKALEDELKSGPALTHAPASPTGPGSSR